MNPIRRLWLQRKLGRPCCHCECPESHDPRLYVKPATWVPPVQPRPRPQFPVDRPHFPEENR